ncbi:MAG: hypothetical protein HKN94_00600 [Acidimicrobiales bacterium]|nr:hypothetical protein [Acidimicrobiales bacterium]
MHLRIGGVPEHFNLPWRLAIEEGRFEPLGCTAEWIDFPGGTGAIMAAFDDGSIDIATPLTEGAVTAIANGNNSRLVAIWVTSPLLWGVHAAGTSTANTIDDMAGQRFAISRFGSGSDLMSRVMAREYGWEISEESFVPVGDLDGARAALPAGEAEIFMWSKSMTQPHVDDGTFKRVGIYGTPWSAFAVSARCELLDTNPELVRNVVGEAATRARSLAADPTLPELVVDRYGIALADALAWSEQVEWRRPFGRIDSRGLQPIIETMTELGRIEHVAQPVDVISPKNGRRTFTDAVEHTATVRREASPNLFAEVQLRIEPASGGVTFSVDLDDINPVWVDSIEHGVRSAAIAPRDGGDPVVGVHITLTGHEEHPADSGRRSFFLAGVQCFNEALDIATTTSKVGIL